MNKIREKSIVFSSLYFSVILLALMSSNLYVSDSYALFHSNDSKEEKKDTTIKMDTPKAIWYNLGRFYADHGNSTGAIAAFDRALSIDPDFIEALNSKAYVLRDLGNYSQSIEFFNKVIEKDSKHKWAWNNIGYSLLQLGNVSESVGYIDKALEIDPHYQSALENKATVMMKIGKMHEAKKIFQDILNKYPDDEYAMTSLNSLSVNKSNNSS
ncbi:MAG: tetratricopeptide repeat protein [Nitrososphaeraceae archaeon]